jgi:hypothetical protein
LRSDFHGQPIAIAQSRQTSRSAIGPRNMMPASMTGADPGAMTVAGAPHRAQNR